MSEETLRKLIITLYKIDGVKFGNFTLKSGLNSPVYFDLRVIISYPEVLRLISELVGVEVEKQRKDFDVLCGVPYTALPIASLVSINHAIPMVLKRKEQKTYGTGKLIEGVYNSNSRCLIIEDVITSGSSIVETAIALRAHGLQVSSAIMILDRDQGAQYNLELHGIRSKPLITMDKMLEVLASENLINSSQTIQVQDYLNANQLFSQEDVDFNEHLNTFLVPRISSPVSIKLVKIMQKKKSNLCLSADLSKWEDVLEAADLLGSKICLLKTHVDTLNLKGVKVITGFWEKLKELATKHDFLIMEDRKFADIGSTVQKQLESKPFEIAKWADLVTMHAISGPGVLKAIETLGPQIKGEFGAVLIAEMSSEQNISTCLKGYKELVYKTVEGFEPFVAGFVSQSQHPSMEDFGSQKYYFLQFTPGVSLSPGAKGDGLGQQYTSIEDVVLKRGADVIIVGRGILNNDKEKWAQVAEEFRTRGWFAFRTKVSGFKAA